MDEKQEAQWLYAKGLELAILIKGVPDTLPNNMEKGFQVNDFITKNYHKLAKIIARRIVISSGQQTGPD